MKQQKKLSIRTQLTLMVMFIVIICTAIAGGSYLFVERHNQKQQIFSKLTALSKITASHSAGALDFDSQDVAAELLAHLSAAGFVEIGCLYDKSDNIFATYTISTDFSCPDALGDISTKIDRMHIHTVAASVRENMRVGTVYLRANVQELNTATWFSALAMLIISLCTIFIAYPLSRLFQKTISEPILELAKTSDEIAHSQDYQPLEPPNSVKELNSLYDAFNNMLTRINENERKLKESEQRLQAIVDNSGNAIFLKDLEGYYLFVNRQFEKTTGLSRDAICGITDDSLFDSKYSSVFRENDQAVMKANKPMEFEEKVPLPNGMHSFISTKFLLYDHRDKPYAVCGISTDITDRVEMEEALRRSRLRLLLHREQSPLAIIEWDTEFKVIDWNPAAEAVFGYTRNEAVGQHCKHLIFAEESEAQCKQIQEDLLNKESQHSVILNNINKFKEKLVCEWNNTPLINEEGNIIGITSLVEDITQKRQQEEQVRRSQKLDALGKLTGGIAHDFNNMLSVILGFAGILQSNEKNPNKLKQIKEIYHAAERSADLTRKLLAFSTKTHAKPEQVDINAVLLAGKDMLHKTLTARIYLDMQLGKDLWPVWIDAGELEAAIRNISINAMHAMEKGGEYTISTSNVEIGALESKNYGIKCGQYVLLSFTDNGTGMDKAIQSQIFEPFFTTKGDKGTGLGLSQVYGMARKAGGTVKVYSEPGEGSRFLLYLPKYIPTATITDSLKKIKTVELTGNETILVVDDERAVKILTESILREKGYNVISADNGEDALRILKEIPVDLLISDIIMPKMDGYELTRRACALYPKLKILLVSGFDEKRRSNPELSKPTGIYLQKPFNPKNLLEYVRKTLDSRAAKPRRP